MDTEKAAKDSWSPVLLDDENKILGKDLKSTRRSLTKINNLGQFWSNAAKCWFVNQAVNCPFIIFEQWLTERVFLVYVRRNLTSSHSKSMSIVRTNNHWIETGKLGAVSRETSHHVLQELIEKLGSFTAKTKISKKNRGCETISNSHLSWFSGKSDKEKSKSRKKVTFFTC